MPDAPPSPPTNSPTPPPANHPDGLPDFSDEIDLLKAIGKRIATMAFLWILRPLVRALQPQTNLHEDDK